MLKFIAGLIPVFFLNSFLLADSDNRVYDKYCREFVYCKHVIDSSVKYGLDPALTMAILLHESSGGKNTNVHGKLVYVQLKHSRSGWYRAQGLMQVMPYNFNDVRESEWLIPSVNIDRGAYLLSRCQKKYAPNFVRIVSCYNMGEYNSKINYRYVQSVAMIFHQLKQR